MLLAQLGRLDHLGSKDYRDQLGQRGLMAQKERCVRCAACYAVNNGSFIQLSPNLLLGISHGYSNSLTLGYLNASCGLGRVLDLQEGPHGPEGIAGPDGVHGDAGKTFPFLVTRMLYF